MAEDTNFQSRLSTFGTNFKRKFDETKTLIYQLKPVSYSESTIDFALNKPSCFGTSQTEYRRQLDREIGENRLRVVEKRNSELQERLIANETIIQHFVQLINQLVSEFDSAVYDTLNEENRRIKHSNEIQKKYSDIECKLKASQSTINLKDEELRASNSKISDLQVALLTIEKAKDTLQKSYDTIVDQKTSLEKKIMKDKDIIKDMKNNISKLQIELNSREANERQTNTNLKEISELCERERLMYERQIDALKRDNINEIEKVRQAYECEFAEKMAEEVGRHKDEMENQRNVHEKALKKSRDQFEELMRYKDLYFQTKNQVKYAEDNAIRKVLADIDGVKRKVLYDKVIREKNDREERARAPNPEHNLAGVFLNDFRGSEAGSLSGSSIDNDENAYARQSRPSDRHHPQKRTRAASETRATAKKPTTSNMFPHVVYKSTNLLKRPGFK